MRYLIILSIFNTLGIYYMVHELNAIRELLKKGKDEDKTS